LNTSPVDLFYSKFEQAAGRAVLFELKIRLFADKTKNISKLSDSHDFDRVYKAVLSEFESKLSDSDREQLKLGKKLRDHIVHAEFQKAFWRLKPAPGGVRMISNLGTTGEEILKKIEAVMSGNEEAKIVPMAKNSGKFGWLLEAANGSLLDEAYENSTKAIAIVDRVSLEHALE